MKTYLFSILLTLVTSTMISAHSRTEIGFKFTEEENNTYLEVHLTSLTLFDFLYEKYPELKAQEALNLSNYIEDYQDYFNQILKLELNGESRTLAYVESNLIIHDAFIKFLVEGLDNAMTSYNIVIDGFNFYQKPSYTFLFATSAFADIKFLSREDNTCSDSTNTALAGSNNEFMFSPYWQLAVIPLGLFLMWFVDRKLL